MIDYYHEGKALVGLPELPKTERGIRKLATRESWPSRPRAGKGGGREYAESALPKAAQKALKRQRDLAKSAEIIAQIAAAERPAAPTGQESLPVPATARAVAAPRALKDAPTTLSEDDLKDWQRRVRDARIGVCRSVQKSIDLGLGVELAYAGVISQALQSGPDSVDYRMLTLARDHRGRPGGCLSACGHAQADAAALPSFRTVQRWLAAGLGATPTTALAPQTRQKPFVMPEWGPGFLACWQVPQKVSVQQAYDEFLRHLPFDSAQGTAPNVPSIHQCRRLIAQLPAVVREKGRMGPRELKNIKPFVRRTFEHLWPNDVWSADGHTFDAEVQHPLHGKPFRPEITTIVDIGTRRITGFSIGLAESTLVVVDALRHAVMTHGVPALFYVDNGSGYANELLEDAATGLLARLGIEVKHSLPYNSQARGVIERLHRSVWVPLAKTLPSYMGADMDREAKQQNFKDTRPQAGNVVTRLPLAWHLFMQRCEDAIAAYHARPHHGLPKFADPVTGQRRHYTPDEWAAHRAEVCQAEGYAPVLIDPQDADSLFRPRVTRTVLRAEIKLFNNIYHAAHLAEWHETSVQVGYDIHDPDRIWVYDETGRYLGTAKWNGNSKSYMPVSVLEQARDGRAEARVKRLQRQADEVEAERTGNAPLQIETIPAVTLDSVQCSVVSGQPEESGQWPVARGQQASSSLTTDHRSLTTPLDFPDPADGRARYQFWRDLQTRSDHGEDLPEAYRLFLQSFPKTRVYRIWDEHFNGQPLTALASGH